MIRFEEAGKFTNIIYINNIGQREILGTIHLNSLWDLNKEKTLSSSDLREIADYIDNHRERW